MDKFYQKKIDEIVRLLYSLRQHEILRNQPREKASKKILSLLA